MSQCLKVEYCQWGRRELIYQDLLEVGWEEEGGEDAAEQEVIEDAEEVLILLINKLCIPLEES